MERQTSDEMMLVACAISLGIVMLGFVGTILWALLQLFRSRDDDGIPEWKESVMRALGVSAVPTPTPEFALEVDGIVVEIASHDGRYFDVTGTCPERDLAVRAGGDVGFGAGWERLSTETRRKVVAFARDGGELSAGRTHMRVEGIEGAATAAQRVSSLTRALGGANASPQSSASILRRVSGASDPGRVSTMGDSSGALSPPADAGALSFASRRKT